MTKRGKDIDYEAKADTLAGRRYIVCRNNEQMKKDAAARAAILTALERQLKKGDKSLVGNKGYRRFLATPDDDHFAIDRAEAEEDAKFDGIFEFRTNADLTPLEAMLCYKRLWMSAMRLRRPRQWGACWMATLLWYQLRLDEFSVEQPCGDGEARADVERGENLGQGRSDGKLRFPWLFAWTTPLP